MFWLDDAVELLVGERREWFKHERAIRLFQFHVWTLTSTHLPAATAGEFSLAGQMAAIKFLDYLEEEEYVESEDSASRKFSTPFMERPLINLADKPEQTTKRILIMREHSTIYREIYDRMLAVPGGLLALLGTPSPSRFDRIIEKQRENAEAAVGVINYLLRYIQHGDLRVKGGATSARAFHFMWAPTKDIPGRRGTILEGKSPSARTLAAKWRQFERSAIFIYLNERHGFSQSPIPIDDDEFVPILLKQSEQIEELRHYFGAYAYIAESLEAAGGEPPFVTVPDTIDRVPVSTAPFSDAELKIIGDYNEDKPIIDTKLEPDDLGI